MIHAENRLAPRMVLIITNHEYRRKLEQTFQNFRIPIYYQCQGHGTAPSEMLDIFGLSGSGRLLTIGLLPKFLVRDLLDALQQRIPLHKRGGGIVLTIPITGLQRPMLQLLNDQMRETIEQKIEERVDSDMSDMQTSAGYTAIWVALSNGYSSDAIDAARSAGAMGGTILKGRRQNSKRISQKLGISMQEEEEFVVIVTPREKKAAVMNAISDACGLRTDAHGIILSLPVDEVIGLETGENPLYHSKKTKNAAGSRLRHLRIRALLQDPFSHCKWILCAGCCTMAAESKGGTCNGTHSRNCSPEKILRQGAESDPRARRHLVSGHAGRVSRHHGQQRLGQIDAAQLHCDRHRTDRRRRRPARQVHHDAARQGARRLPRQGDRLPVSEL